jgi:hypothetical protein
VVGVVGLVVVAGVLVTEIALPPTHTHTAPTFYLIPASRPRTGGSSSHELAPATAGFAGFAGLADRPLEAYRHQTLSELMAFEFDTIPPFADAQGARGKEVSYSSEYRVS